MKAVLRQYRQSPRKVRLVATLIQGKPVDMALLILDAAPKHAAFPLHKLLTSAVANAKQLGFTPAQLIVKEARVDGAQVLKRSMPRARGSAFPIKKRSSHILLTLAEKPEPKVKKAKAKKE